MSQIIETLDFPALHEGLRNVFTLLTDRLGVRNPVLYGGALRDTDQGKAIQDYDFVGQLTVMPGQDKNGYDQHAGAFFMNFAEHLPDLPLTLRMHEETGTLRVRFEQAGKRIDLGLKKNPLPEVERMADYGSIGLCSIAMGADGVVWASDRYMRDRDNRTLSIKPDLPRGEYAKARAKASDLQQDRYLGYNIVDPGPGRDISVIRGIPTLSLCY